MRGYIEQPVGRQIAELTGPSDPVVSRVVTALEVIHFHAAPACVNVIGCRLIPVTAVVVPDCPELFSGDELFFQLSKKVRLVRPSSLK